MCAHKEITNVWCCQCSVRLFKQQIAFMCDATICLLQNYIIKQSSAAAIKVNVFSICVAVNAHRYAFSKPTNWKIKLDFFFYRKMH